MKAAVYYETGGPEVFRYEDVATPVPKANEVLVQVEFISIEGGDTLSRFAGRSPSGPYIVGYQDPVVVVRDDGYGDDGTPAVRWNRSTRNCHKARRRSMTLSVDSPRWPPSQRVLVRSPDPPRRTYDGSCRSD